MKHGLVFRADKGDTLQDTLQQAAARYRERFAGEPNVVYVHPDTPKFESTLRVVRNQNVAPNHLWLEIEETA